MHTWGGSRGVNVLEGVTSEIEITDFQRLWMQETEYEQHKSYEHPLSDSQELEKYSLSN